MNMRQLRRRVPTSIRLFRYLLGGVRHNEKQRARRAARQQQERAKEDV